MTDFLRVQQTYGPTAAPAGTATPRTGVVKFGNGVGDPASYNVGVGPSGGFAMSAHALINSAPVGTNGIVAVNSALSGTLGLHKIEAVAGGRIIGTISGPAGATVTLPGLAVPAVGKLLFAAMSYDDVKARATLWTWTQAGGFSETSVAVPFTPTTAVAWSVGHNGSGTAFPGIVEQVSLFAFKVDVSQVLGLLAAKTDPMAANALATAAVGLPGAQAHTNVGVGNTRLLAGISCTISKGANAGDPGGTTHRVSLPAASGVTVGTRLATSWGLAMQVLGVTVGAGSVPDVLTCMRL